MIDTLVYKKSNLIGRLWYDFLKIW